MNTIMLSPTRLVFCLTVLLFSFGCGSAEDTSTPQTTVAVPQDTAQTGMALITESATAKSKPGTVTSGYDFSVISISTDPAVNFLMTDPGGLRTGLDPASGKSYREIPNSAYYGEYIEDPDGEAGMGTEDLEIRTPATGEYHLTLTASSTVTYSLYVRLYDFAGESKGFDITDISIAQGESQTYILEYNRDNASEGTFATDDQN